MTGFYLKEKRHAGETSSLKRILEKYIEKSRLWQFLSFFFFFLLSGTILYLSFRGKCVFSGEGAGRREGRCFFCVGSEVQRT